VHESHDRVALALEGIGDLLRVDGRAPLELEQVDPGAEARSHVLHALGEDAVGDHEDPVTRLTRLTKQVSMPAMPVPDIGRVSRLRVLSSCCSPDLISSRMRMKYESR